MHRLCLIAAALFVVPANALGGVTPPSDAGLVGSEPVGPQNPYTGRSTTGGVLPNEVSSMSLRMIDSQDNSVTINMGGDVLVTRGSTATNLGSNRNGGGNILGSWDEVVQGNNVFINAVYRTSDGSMFMPPTARVNGQPAFFWTWKFGVSDPVSYHSWVTQVNLLSARIFFSDNGGMSFNSFSNISGLGSSFMPGRDHGNYLASIGDGTNYIMLQYQIQIIPAPAGFAALGAGALMVARRRRR